MNAVEAQLTPITSTYSSEYVDDLRRYLET